MANGIAKRFGYDTERMERTRVAMGLTKAALARKAKISPATVASALRGSTGTPTTFGKLAAALGMPLADLTVPLGPEVRTPEAPEISTR